MFTGSSMNRGNRTTSRYTPRRKPLFSLSTCSNRPAAITPKDPLSLGDHIVVSVLAYDHLTYVEGKVMKITQQLYYTGICNFYRTTGTEFNPFVAGKYRLHRATPELLEKARNGVREQAVRS